MDQVKLNALTEQANNIDVDALQALASQKSLDTSKLCQIFKIVKPILEGLAELVPAPIRVIIKILIKALDAICG